MEEKDLSHRDAIRLLQESCSSRTPETVDAYASLGTGLDDRRSTGLVGLDETLYGGLQAKQIVELVGEAGAGKTSFCVTVCVRYLVANPSKSVAYVDCDGKVSLERWTQVCASYGVEIDSVASRVAFVRPSSLDALATGVDRLCAEADVGIVVVDSVAALVLSGPKQTSYELTTSLASCASALKRCAETYDLAVLVTNRVDSTKTKAALGAAWKHAVNVRMFLSFLRDDDHAGRRRLRIVKSPFSIEYETSVIVDQRGAVDE